MREWPSRFPIVGEVRGLGLMLGVELVRDQVTKERAPDLREKVVNLAFERGLLILGAGDTTLRLCPPLVITRDQCDFAIDTLEECLAAVGRALFSKCAAGCALRTSEAGRDAARAPGTRRTTTAPRYERQDSSGSRSTLGAMHH